MTRVRIDPLAGRELADGADYYDERSPGLGDAFLDEFSRAIQQLSENPRSGPVIRGAIRRRPLLRFPYSLFYRIAAGEVQVLAVVHQRRGPRYIASRLRGA